MSPGGGIAAARAGSEPTERRARAAAPAGCGAGGSRAGGELARLRAPVTRR